LKNEKGKYNNLTAETAKGRKKQTKKNVSAVPVVPAVSIIAELQFNTLLWDPREQTPRI
jgi:uncharacterized protein Veg